MEISKKNKNTNDKNKLSILISQDGLSFCTSKLQSNEVALFVEKKFDKTLDPIEILQQVELAFEEQKTAFDDIGKVLVIYANLLYSFVPQALFDKNHLSDYLKFNTKILNTDFIDYDELKEQELNNVYIPYANINNYFFEKFGSFEFTHATTLFVGNILSLPGDHKEETVFINVHLHHFDMVVTKAGKLLLCNSFSYDTPEDFVYYILFTAEQLKLDPEEFALKFTGEITTNSETYKRCYQYIRNCSFLEDKRFLLQTGKEFSDILSRKHYLLKKAHLCA